MYVSIYHVSNQEGHTFQGCRGRKVLLHLRAARKVDERLPGKENSNSNGARPVH